MVLEVFGRVFITLLLSKIIAMAYTNLENNAITAITANFQLIIHAVSYILSILICYAFKALIPLLSKTMETLILPNHQTWPNYQTISKVIWNKVFEANFVEVSLSVENGVKIFAFFFGWIYEAQIDTLIG